MRTRMNHVYHIRANSGKRKQNLHSKVTYLEKKNVFIIVAQYCQPQFRILVLLFSFEVQIDTQRIIASPAGIALTVVPGLGKFLCELKSE